MEKRTSIETQEVTKTFYDIVITNKETGYKVEETRDSLKDAECTINVYLKCSKWSLVSIEKVERILVKLISA